jgi:hypothetical protein
MSTHIHVSGLSYFCTDEKLRQAFMPFGTVVLAQVLRDEYGHSLGVGVVHMARSEDVARVFNADQRFEVSGSRVDLWEPADRRQVKTRGTGRRGRRPLSGGLAAFRLRSHLHGQPTAEVPTGIAKRVADGRRARKDTHITKYPTALTLCDCGSPYKGVALQIPGRMIPYKLAGLDRSAP